ncbi:MAG: alpha/beta fold hydrolase, partial [Mariprofundaceae bacterium]|nr:alpha/beta fold hydrolase [Mariprofundaceae bacterium]
KQIELDLWSGWAEVDALMQRDYPEVEPIILVHGWNGDEFTWPEARKLKKVEEKLGRDIYYFNFRTGAFPNRYPPLEALEEYLERFIKGFDHVDIVAHSMGGLLVRQFLAHHPDHNVRRLLLLSVPNFGASAAGFLTQFSSISATGNAQAQEIEPGSDFLWHLNSLGGSEMEGVEVLNAYALPDGILDRDVVVDPATAWLPWVANVTVAGDHHVLARRLDEFSFIQTFLSEGALPENLAGQPEGREIWLRVSRAGGGQLRFANEFVKQFDPAGRPVRGNVSICCEKQSSLYDQRVTTVIVKDVWKGQSLELMDRSTSPPVTIRFRVPGHLPHPVNLINFEVGGKKDGSLPLETTSSKGE